METNLENIGTRIKGHSSSFIRMFDKIHGSHDWFLKDIIIANSGSAVKKYSRSECATVQIEFAQDNYNLDSVLLIYVNVKKIDITFDGSLEFKEVYLGFGVCDNYKITGKEKLINHMLSFPNGATIKIVCEKIDCQIQKNNWL